MTAILNGVAYFAKGERVRLSAEGKQALGTSPYHGGRHGKKTDWHTRLGTVAAANRGQCVSIRWDGNVTTGSIHQSFIERADIDVVVPTAAS